MATVRGRRYLLILAVLAGLVGVYAAVGFLLVPRWTRSELVRLTSQDFGRRLSLGGCDSTPSPGRCGSRTSPFRTRTAGR